jgi:phosphatidylglycerophosphate synthase
MPVRTPHSESMTEVFLTLSHSGPDPRWPLVRVAGLSAVDRNLMALHSVGVAQVTLCCGSSEYALLAPRFAARRADPRLPVVSVARLDALPAASGNRPALVLDGRRVYHPELLRRRLAVAAEGAGAGSNPALPPPLYDEDITTPAGRRRARRAIRRSLRKPTDGWFARTIDRSVSLAISAVLAPFPVHPNAVTRRTLGVGVASGLLAARGTYAGFVAAGALFLLASVLDGVDGELARMKFQGSSVGQWLDTVCDDLTNAIYLAGVTAGAWHTFASPFLLWAGVTAVALDIVTVGLLYWELVTRVNARTLLAFEETILAPALKEHGLTALVARLQPFIKRDVYAPLFLVFALLGIAWVSLPATSVALVVTLVFLVRDLARSGRRAEGAAA